MRKVILSFAWLLSSTVLLASTARATDTVYYYHTDALHSEVVITDAGHNVVERTYYGPYGEVLNRPLRDGPGYGGHEEDAATGLDNLQQRYYDPITGRFPSIDPVDVDTTTGENFNRYAYANDNPYRYTDPDGRCTGTHTNHCPSGVKIILVNPDKGLDTKLGGVPGYSESGKNSWRGSNDSTFANKTAMYNDSRGLDAGDDGYIDAKTVKAWAMVESGGNKSAFLSDPLQVNVPGDWSPEKASILGLSKGQAMTPAISTTAGLNWWSYKGYIHDAQGSQVQWRGDFSAFERYNANGAMDKTIDGVPVPHYEWYAHEILDLRAGM